jgi:hypothetical protein
MGVESKTRPGNDVCAVIAYDKVHWCMRTFGDEKLSLGKTAPYSCMHSRILVSSSGNEKHVTTVSSASSSSESFTSLSLSSSESVLSAGLGRLS